MTLVRKLRLATLAVVLAGPAVAQTASDPVSPGDISDVDALPENYGESGPEEAEDDLRVGPRPPWTLQLRLPLDWRSDLGSRSDGSRLQGLTFNPDLSLSRRWRLGPVRLFTEAGAFQSRILPEAARDSSAFYGTFEAELGDSSAGFVPYAGYEPSSIHGSSFGRHIVTLHDLSLGARRDFGATFLELYLRRQEASDTRIERSGFGGMVSHSVPLAGRAVLNLRGEAEYRRFDRRDGVARDDLRTRLRARAIIPLQQVLDLQLTADIQRLDSSEPGASFMNFILGPAVVVRLGF